MGGILLTCDPSLVDGWCPFHSSRVAASLLSVGVAVESPAGGRLLVVIFLFIRDLSCAGDCKYVTQMIGKDLLVCLL